MKNLNNMFKIICPNCKAENKFYSKSSQPCECSFCWEPIPEESEIVDEGDNREITGLTIIYQITQQKLEISASHKVILGRENFGSHLFSEILDNGKPVVSRKHCSLEFKDGNFYLLDESSVNGTFYGVAKLNCKDSPQLIEDKSIFYIGEEPFIAHLNYKEIAQNKEEIDVEPQEEDTKAIKFYRCNDQNCPGYESPTPFDVCPKCNAYKNIIPVYE